MSDNPFSNFEIRIPKKFSDQVKNYCSISKSELKPFERQVDFWYFAFLYAVKKELRPVHYDNKDMVHIISGNILSKDPYRIKHIQAVYLGVTKDIQSFANHRQVFDFATNLANAGIPHIIQIASDSDNKPLWNIFDTIEELIA